MSQLDLALAVGLVFVAEITHNKKHFNLEHLYKISIAVPITQFFDQIS